MKIININSGFQRGGTLWQWTGTEFIVFRYAAENTWHNDGDSSFECELPENFKGAVTRFRGVSSLSYCDEVDEWIGFSDSELAAPTSITGWASKQSSICRASDDWRVATFADYWAAKLTGASFTPDSELITKGGKSASGQVLARLGYDAGDQRADGWAVYSPEGWFLSSHFGAGDNTPEPYQDDAGNWAFTTPRLQWHKYCQEADDRVYAAQKRGDAMEGGGLLTHIRACYARGMNPLPTCRKNHLGKWAWRENWGSDVDSRAVLFRSHDRWPDGDNPKVWEVEYLPA